MADNKQNRIFNRLVNRITSLTPIERVTGRTQPYLHTKSVDEEFEDLIQEFDAIETAFSSLMQLNLHYVSCFKEVLRSSERTASLVRLLTYKETSTETKKAPWDRTKSYLAALKEILFAVHDPLESLVSVVNKRVEVLAGFLRTIGEKILARDKALLNYDKVYEKYDQMTIHSTVQKLTPKEVQRYEQLEKKMQMLKREFDSCNSTIKMELPTYFILVRNLTEPMLMFAYFTHLTVFYQYKLNLLSIRAHFDEKNSLAQPEFYKNIVAEFEELSEKELPVFTSEFGIEHLIMPLHEGRVGAKESVDTPGERPRKYCRALYDFTSTDKNDLKFRKGDLIQVLDRSGEWWIGYFKGTKGLFPASYVEAAEKKAT